MNKMKIVTVQNQHKLGVTFLQFLAHPADGLKAKCSAFSCFFKLSKINVAENMHSRFLL